MLCLFPLGLNLLAGVFVAFVEGMGNDGRVGLGVVLARMAHLLILLDKFPYKYYKPTVAEAFPSRKKHFFPPLCDTCPKLVIFK